MRRPRLWPGIIVAVLGVHVCIVVTTALLATADKSVAVEPDYYRKAVAWDRQRDVENRSSALGWTVRLTPGAAAGPATPLRIDLAGPDGAPIAGAALEVEAFANVRSADRRRTTLKETTPGTYEGTFNADRSGLWQFRLSASRALDRFVGTFESEVAAPGESRP